MNYYNTLLDYTKLAYDIKKDSRILSLFKGDTFYFNYTQGFYLFKRDELVIGVSGSQTFDHWLLNLKLHQRKFKQATVNMNMLRRFNISPYVHTGFYRAALLIFRKLRDDGVLDNKISIIKICGHSKGGAIASLLALLIQNFKYKQDNSFYRFFDDRILVFRVGCPKIGNEDYAKVEEKSIYKNIEWHSFSNQLDPIPRLPFIGYVSSKIKNQTVSGPWHLFFKAHSLKLYQELIRNKY